MREIIFKGKNKKTGKWVEGNLIVKHKENKNIENLDGNKIILETKYSIQYKNKKGKYVSCEVLEKTIGQYTGLHDKKEKEIYEGDIVELTDEGRQIYGTKEHPSRKYQLVGFKDGGFMTGRSDIDCEFLNTYLWILKDYITVVGNKFDNPELLEDKE